MKHFNIGNTATRILSIFFLLALATKSHAQSTTAPNDNAAVNAGNGNGPANPVFTVEEVFDKLDVDHDAKLTLKDMISIDSDSSAEVTLSELTSHFNGNANGDGGDTVSSASDETGGFMKGFTSSTAMIIATEIGDKTFFIAAVLSMRHSRLFVFFGALLALVCMTILSTMMGLILPNILPRQYTHIIGGVLFLYFGIKLIYDSRSMTDKVSDELEEVEEELLHTTTNKKNDQNDDAEQNTNANLEQESSSSPPTTSVPMGNNTGNANHNSSPVHNIFFQSFILTFLAEWGDRSQIATIALAAAKDPYGVTVGACFGHSLCTGMAVVGGRILASRISEKTVSFWGGVIFLLFAIHALFFDM